MAYVSVKCHGTRSGGCVVGRCWEACPSWVPVSLLALHRLAGSAQSLVNAQGLYKERYKTDRVRQGRVGQGSEMRGFLLLPSSSPTLSSIYDGLDVSVTSNITWFCLNLDMVSRRIYILSFYGGHSIRQRRFASFRRHAVVAHRTDSSSSGPCKQRK